MDKSFGKYLPSMTVKLFGGGRSRRHLLLGCACGSGVDRVFLHDPGANDTFCAGDITEEMLDGIDHFHFGYPPLMKKCMSRMERSAICLKK